MVGELAEYSDDTAATETVISADNIFVEDGFFSAAGLLENIAQTCAARIGYYNLYVIKNNRIQIGFIGALKGITIARLPKVGERIRTTIRVQKEIFGMILADARVEGTDGLIAEGEIKLAIEEDGA